MMITTVLCQVYLMTWMNEAFGTTSLTVEMENGINVFDYVRVITLDAALGLYP